MGGELSSQMRADNPPLILLLLPPYSQGHINETTVPLSLSFKGFLFFLRLAGYCLKERCFSFKAGSGRVGVALEGDAYERKSVVPVTFINIETIR